MRLLAWFVVRVNERGDIDAAAALAALAAAVDDDAVAPLTGEPRCCCCCCIGVFDEPSSVDSSSVASSAGVNSHFDSSVVAL